MGSHVQVVASPRATSTWSGDEELEDAADYQARVPEAPNMAQFKRSTVICTMV